MTVGMSPLQRASIGQATARVNIWHGAVRAGKTIASLTKFAQAVRDAPPSGEIVVLGNTRESVARNVFGPLSDPELFGRAASEVKYTAGAPTGVMFGRRVHVIGASDARSERVLRGMTAFLIYVDEATLVAQELWNQALARLSLEGAQLFATTNPDGPAHWLKTEVLDRARDLGYRAWRFRLADNPYLPVEYVDQISREYTGLWYKRFILGEWVQAEGAVYDSWDPDRHVINMSGPNDLRPLCLGIDYGTTNPTRGVLVCVQTEPRGSRLVVAREWAPLASTDSELLADLLTTLNRWEREGLGRPPWVAVDPSASSFRLALNRASVYGITKAQNRVVDGIRTVAGLLATRPAKLVVVGAECPKLLEEFPGYVWDPKATKRGEDQVIKRADHSLDALRYATHTSRQLWLRDVPMTSAVPVDAV